VSATQVIERVPMIQRDFDIRSGPQKLIIKREQALQDLQRPARGHRYRRPKPAIGARPDINL
tara:strand:- start:118 stop:303 length:186 start_codon:yes stop_codon:yes gene_type:complete